MKTKIPTKISTKKVTGYKSIYFLNGFTAPTLNLFKYMQFERFLSSVKDKELIFVSPDNWKDPFERLFYKTNYNSLGFGRPEIACMCVTSKAILNEEASWKMYINPLDKALRLTIDFSEFCNILDDFAVKNDYLVYFGKVIYDLKKDEISTLHKTKSALHATYFPTKFSLENYLTLMLLKRSSFAFENEVRVFLVKKGSITFDKGLLRITNVNYTKKFIPRVVIAPYEPLPKDDIKTPFRKRINEIESDEYKKEIRDLFGCTVLQSQLYTDCPPIDKI
jgi:hypothetical protein